MFATYRQRFVNGTFDLFDVTCEQQNRTAFKQFLNGAKNGDIDGTCKKVQVMACSHCPVRERETMGFYMRLCTVHTAQGQGPGPELGTMGFCMRLCTVHTAQEQGPALGMMGFCMRLCTVHNTQGQGMMGFSIRLCTVHTTRDRDQGQDLGTMGFCIRLCTIHTTQDRDRERWVSILHYVLYTLHRDRNREQWVSV